VPRAESRTSGPGDSRGERHQGAREIGPQVLAEVGRPTSGDEGDKFERGQVVVLGGEPETPGGVVLAALAALRAGAGRAHVVTDPSIAVALAVATPEVRVTPFTGSSSCPDLAASDVVRTALADADAVLVGSGCVDPDGAGSLLEQAVALVGADTCLLVDAAALSRVARRDRLLSRFGKRAVLLPNPGEAASLLERPIEEVQADPHTALVEVIARCGTTTAIRGGTTWIADEQSGPFVECGGHRALGTSGSGDVLAGIVLGLAARGGAAMSAVVWGVHVHSRCGEVLAARNHGIGLLARELLDEVPRVLNELLER
jgi:ADP-dependent NAD(P)H-hydrate dehydratase